MALGSKKYNVQILKLRLGIFATLLLCGLLSLSLYHRLTIQRDMVLRREEVEEEKQRLEQRHAEMQYKANYIQSKDGIESEIRKNFDVVKEGESVIILVEDERPSADVVATPTQIIEIRPWWRFW